MKSAFKLYIRKIIESLKYIFSKHGIWKMKIHEYQQLAKECSIFYNECKIIIFCNNETPKGFTVYSMPIVSLPINVTLDALNNSIYEVLGNSTVCDDHEVDNGLLLLYRSMKVRNWDDLVKHWNLINIELMFNTKEIYVYGFVVQKDGRHYNYSNGIKQIITDGENRLANVVKAIMGLYMTN